ncbi:MAG: YitT family protein [Odoribacter sp.]
MNVTKASFYKEKIFSAEWFQTYVILFIGSMVIATGYTFFMTPYKIVPGGIYGISTILNHKLGFPIGMAALCFNLPLSLIGIKILGRQFGVKTFICFLWVAMFADGLPWMLEHAFGYPHELAIDPLQLVKGGIDNPNAAKEGILLASIFGGVVIGLGAGLILKTRSSSGGTDVLSSILHKLTRKPLGMMQMMVDSVIVVLGFIAFPDWKTPFYSLITIFIMGKVIDVVLGGYSSDKTFFIISDKTEDLRHYILSELHRGGSIVPVNGMWNRAEKEMIMTVVNRKEVTTLQRAIGHIDPNAFTMIMDAKEIMGQGFKKMDWDNN